MQAGRAAILISGILLLGACLNQPSDPNGARLYRDNCASCHGPRGAGNGPLGQDLPITPADLRGLAGSDGVFPTSYVVAKIHGYRDQDLDALMPAFGEELGGPMVWVMLENGQREQAPAAVVALAEYVATLGQ